MVLDRRRILETSLFDLEQIVTVQYLSRHADISIDDAKNELAEFLTQNKNRTELRAVYVLSGKLKIPDPSSDNTSDAAITPKYRTQLIRDCELEEARQAYREVSLCLLYSVDSLEDAQYERSDPKRSWLSYPETETKTKEMLAHYSAVSMPETQKKRIQNLVSSISKSPEPKSKKIKDDITSMFVQTANRSKQEETSSMDNVSQEVEGNIDGKTNIMSGKTIKRRGQCILIDSKEQDMREETESPEIIGLKNVVTKSIEVATSKKKNFTMEARNTFLTQDDLFSDGDSNPDRMDCDEITKTKIDEGKSSRNDGLENEGNYGNQGKVVRKEYVTETFLDNDGFMVTKQVLKEIELEPSSAHASTETCGKTKSTKLLNSKERRSAKIPQGQAKISAFFQKK
ncbi:unnamed protein product [Onchocerca ochengi]|uniref:DNA polymerase delta subunit 3 n=1 Tax=Onchocerca ochengi TaxID=42157 RepID=A0A182E847_ONCOC|nr:unnamed protein product [Onchocerca ochengi]